MLFTIQSMPSSYPLQKLALCKYYVISFLLIVKYEGSTLSQVTGEVTIFQKEKKRSVVHYFKVYCLRFGM